MDKPYSNRELDLKHNELKVLITTGFNSNNARIDDLRDKVEYTNGKVRRLYLIMVVVGSVSGTMLVMSGSELVQFLMAIVI
jgi:tetrahydromethanopterin S-methyltransferase subunit G